MILNKKTTIKFNLFKKYFMFEFGENGCVLDRSDGPAWLYLTNANHNDVLMAFPVTQSKKEAKKNLFTFKLVDDNNDLLHFSYEGFDCVICYSKKHIYTENLKPRSLADWTIASSADNTH